ncbi:sulfate permease [Leifsonia kafniensis]|uniref:Sulfate permease n=1 Tax=Leifsonia kafniensis TaxID=475957 RepID=A0ABP7KKB3_9MICO
MPAIVYAFVVSSRQLVASPDAAAAALVASSLGGLALAGSADYLTLAFAQAILCGIMFALTSVLRLGFLANFLSKPILIGFVGGLALDILVSQIAKMLGVKIDSGGEFVDKVSGLISGLGTTNLTSLAMSVAAVLVLVLGRRFASAVPWALIVLIGATILVVTADLKDAGVAVLGHVDAGAPSFTWPVISWTLWLQLIPSAIALTLVTMGEGLLVSRSYGEKRGYPTSPNRDLMAFGVSNFAAGVSGGFAIGSSTSRTAAMDQAGSRTQLPSVIVGVGTLLLMLFGTSLLENVPSPAIGAIVAVAVIPLLGISEFRSLWKLEKFEFLVGAACFLGALLLGPIAGIVIAFVLSLINLARRAANPAVDILSANDSPDSSLLPLEPTVTMTAPGVIVLRFAAPIFFANVGVLEDAARKAVTRAGAGSVSHLVFDLEAVTDIDVTGAEGFGELLTWLKEKSIQVHYSRMRPEIRDRLAHFDLIEGTTSFGTNRAAIAAFADPQRQPQRQPQEE